MFLQHGTSTAFFFVKTVYLLELGDIKGKIGHTIR